MLDIAILDGVRTPFVKAFGPLASVPAQELGRIATAAIEATVKNKLGWPFCDVGHERAKGFSSSFLREP